MKMRRISTRHVSLQGVIIKKLDLNWFSRLQERRRQQTFENKRRLRDQLIY